MHHIYIETVNPKDDKKTNEFRFFEYLLESLSINVEIIGIGGKSKLSLYEDTFKDTTMRGFKNLVIIDADGSYNTENWSLQSEREKLELLKLEKNIEFEIFFLPNNQNEGDFEILLENIINPAHRRIVDCHKGFEECVKEFGEYVIPNQKARIYSYISSLPMSNTDKENFKNKGDWFFTNNAFWNFNSASLQPLKDFLMHYM